jgi:hypothetical protein
MDYRVGDGNTRPSPCVFLRNLWEKICVSRWEKKKCYRDRRKSVTETEEKVSQRQKKKCYRDRRKSVTETTKKHYRDS